MGVGLKTPRFLRVVGSGKHVRAFARARRIIATPLQGGRPERPGLLFLKLLKRRTGLHAGPV